MNIYKCICVYQCTVASFYFLGIISNLVEIRHLSLLIAEK